MKSIDKILAGIAFAVCAAGAACAAEVVVLGYQTPGDRKSVV